MSTSPEQLAPEGGSSRMAYVLGFPHPPYAWRLIRASALAWAFMRPLLAAAMSAAHQSPAAPPDWRAALLIIALSVALTLLDVRILREGVFYRDLGGNPVWPPVLALIGSGLPEVLLDTFLLAWTHTA